MSFHQLLALDLVASQLPTREEEDPVTVGQNMTSASEIGSRLLKNIRANKWKYIASVVEACKYMIQVNGRREMLCLFSRKQTVQIW